MPWDLPTDIFARHHAAERAKAEREERAKADGQNAADRQQRIKDAAAKRVEAAKPEPRYRAPKKFYEL